MWSGLDVLPELERRRVLEIARRRVFARGEVVFHAGDPADTFHLVHKGRLAVRLHGRFGADTVTVAIVGPNDVFGELALLSATATRTATVVALEPAETRSIHRLDFDRILREHPAAMKVIVEVLSAQVQRLSGQLVETLFEPVERRVLRRVADLVAIYAEEDEGDVVIPLTQETVGELAGTSRPTVNKVLRAEVARGLIELRRGRIVVLDRVALDARAHR